MTNTDIPLFDPSWHPAPLCIAVRVTADGLHALLEQAQQGAQGIYKDAHPWIVAKRLAEEHAAASQWTPLLLATDQGFEYWTRLRRLEVVELHRSAWQTRVTLDDLWQMHPIFTDIDSVFRQPPAEQLEREQREGVSVHRHPLTANELHPYAIGLTPAFVAEVSGSAQATQAKE